MKDFLWWLLKQAIKTTVAAIALVVITWADN